MALKASPYHETNQRQQEKSEETHREAAKKNHPMTLPPELPSSDTGETEPHRSRLCATSNAFGRPTPRPTAPRPTAPRRGPRPRGSRGLTSAARPGAPELLQARARGGRGRRVGAGAALGLGRVLGRWHWQPSNKENSTALGLQRRKGMDGRAPGPNKDLDTASDDVRPAGAFRPTVKPSGPAAPRLDVLRDLLHTALEFRLSPLALLPPGRAGKNRGWRTRVRLSYPSWVA